MQKTVVKYYCDSCGKEIQGFMFSLGFTWGFPFSTRNRRVFRCTDEGVEPTKHYCYPCSRKKVEALGLEVVGVNALLEGGLKKC